MFFAHVLRAYLVYQDETCGLRKESAMFRTNVNWSIFKKTPRIVAFHDCHGKPLLSTDPTSPQTDFLIFLLLGIQLKSCQIKELSGECSLKDTTAFACQSVQQTVFEVWRLQKTVSSNMLLQIFFEASGSFISECYIILDFQFPLFSSCRLLKPFLTSRTKLKWYMVNQIAM